MTKQEYHECDVCNAKIDDWVFTRIKRFLHGYLLRKIEPDRYSSWEGEVTKEGVDICDECWEEIKTEVVERVNDD